MGEERAHSSRLRPAVIALAAIVLLALGVRLTLALAAPFPRIAGDPAVYDEIGLSLAAGSGFARLPRGEDRRPEPTAMHPPGWPWLLGAAYAATGHDDADPGSAPHARWRAARVVQALLGAAAVALVALVAWQLWGAAVAVVAGALAAIHAPSAVLGIALLSEPLFVVLELGALAAVLRHRNAPHGLRWVIVAGVLAGLATLTRSNGAILVPLLAAAVWGGRTRWAPLVLVAVVALTLVPWTVRNAVRMDALVPVATNFGRTVAGTYNAESAQHYYRWVPPRRLPLPAARRAELAAMPEAARSSALTREALRYIRAHPSAVPVASAENTARLAELDPVGRHVLALVVGSRALAALSIAGFALFAVAALAGAATRAARAAPRFVWLMPVAMAASAVPLAVNFSRFRAPLDPFLVLLAALALCTAGGALRRRLDASHD